MMLEWWLLLDALKLGCAALIFSAFAWASVALLVAGFSLGYEEVLKARAKHLPHGRRR